MRSLAFTVYGDPVAQGSKRAFVVKNRAVIVDDNKADYHWHPSPMFHEELAVFSRAGGGEKGIGLRQLEGKRVGYTLGYTYPAEFRQNDKILKFSAKSDHMLLDMLLARKRAGDRKEWLETKGNLAAVQELAATQAEV